MDLVRLGATWLHLVATVVLLGYYAVLAGLVLPALRRAGSSGSAMEVIAGVERRALPAAIGALIVFLATGVYLLGADPQYGGPGDVSSSSWATLLLVKHVLVVAMVGLGAYVDALIARGDPTVEASAAATLSRVTLACWGMALLGAVVLLLSAAVQLS